MLTSNVHSPLNGIPHYLNAMDHIHTYVVDLLIPIHYPFMYYFDQIDQRA